MAFGLTQAAAVGYYYVVERGQPLVYLNRASGVVQDAIAAVTSAFTSVPDELIIPSEGRAIVADLGLMSLSLYEDGRVATTVPIMAKGRPGTPWETPAGQYEVLIKKEKHFSTIGEVWMPYNLQFFGNFFIHGWPTYADGRPVPAGYSGGCIRLADEDAELVFDFASVGTAVIVKGAPRAVVATDKQYVVRKPTPVPWVTAKAYVVADVDTGEVLAQKNWRESLPIASITKLMTALVSLDVINQYQTTLVSKQAVATYGVAGNLKAGEQITISNLIYPLLLESSNDAAEVLAEHHGRGRFISLMNERAKAAGLTQTSFTDPSGLSPQNVSTAEDLFKLARYVYQTKPYIFDVVAKARHTTASYTWTNDNEFLGASYFLGGKNGFTDEAGQTMLSLWSLPLSSDENRRIAIVLLQSLDRKKDAERLLKYVSDTIAYTPAFPTSRAALPAAVWATVPPPPKPRPLTLSFVGDIMLDRGVLSSVRKHAGGDFNWLFSSTTALAASDVLFGNLEGPISDIGKDLGNLYSFRMNTQAAGALRRAGFDVLSIANNHIGDWGQAAFLDTLDELAEDGLVAVGAGQDKTEAFAPKIITVRGTKIGFLAATDVGPNWLAAKADVPGIVIAADPLWPQAIENAAKLVDVLVVSYHFGDEYQTEPNARQRELAELAIDRGAAIVVGHHPHVAQPVEYYKDGVIAYSLGNFIFDQHFSPETMRGSALTITLEDGKITSLHQQGVQLDANFKPSLQP